MAKQNRENNETWNKRLEEQKTSDEMWDKRIQKQHELTMKSVQIMIENIFDRDNSKTNTKRKSSNLKELERAENGTMQIEIEETNETEKKRGRNQTSTQQTKVSSLEAQLATKDRRNLRNTKTKTKNL